MALLHLSQCINVHKSHQLHSPDAFYPPFTLLLYTLHLEVNFPSPFLTTVYFSTCFRNGAGSACKVYVCFISPMTVLYHPCTTHCTTHSLRNSLRDGDWLSGGLHPWRRRGTAVWQQESLGQYHRLLLKWGNPSEFTCIDEKAVGFYGPAFNIHWTVSRHNMRLWAEHHSSVEDKSMRRIWLRVLRSPYIQHKNHCYNSE